MTNEKKRQIIELLKDKEVADSIGVMSEGLVKLFESIPADEPEEKKPYDPGFWLPKADERYYEAYVGKDMIYGLGVGAENGVAYPDNCWKTSERAIEVGKKIKFLMLVERIRDKLQHEGAVPNGFLCLATIRCVQSRTDPSKRKCACDYHMQREYRDILYLLFSFLSTLL